MIPHRNRLLINPGSPMDSDPARLAFQEIKLPLMASTTEVVALMRAAMRAAIVVHVGFTMTINDRAAAASGRSIAIS